MRHLQAKALTLLLTLAGAAGPAGAAAAPVCEEARRLVGDTAGTLTDAECQDLVDAAEEERWQLWLDMALAHEHSGDALAAIPYYQRFLEATDARTRPLSEAWIKVREDARAAVKRLDAELRATLGRVIVRSPPSEALASFEGKAVGGASHTTPFGHYLPPGNHVLELYHPSASDLVHKRFTLEKGQVLHLDVNLALELAAAEAARGKAKAAAAAAAAPVAAPAQDASGGPRVLRTVGWLGVAAGAGLAAVGTIFYAQGQAYLDEARCGDAVACAPTAAERARRRSDGESLQDRGLVAWVAGGALLAGGIVAIVLGDDEPASAEPRSGWRLEGVTPAFGADGAPGLGAAWSF